MELSLEKVETEILNFFISIAPLTDEVKKEICAIFEVKLVKKDTLILQSGHKMNKMWFLYNGLLRSYFLKDGKECTTWIMNDKLPFTNYRSFVTSEPSIENIVTVEDCILLESTREKVNGLYEKYHSVEKIGRIIAETYFIKHDAHLHSILFSSAEERYNEFNTKNPTIIDRMKAKDIASYLGMTKETFSRLCSKNKGK